MRLPLARLLRTTLLSSLATSILLLSGCAKKEQELPVPTSASIATTVKADVLRQLFVSKQYDLVVNKKPDEGKASVRWEPQWQFLTWKRSADQVLYAFIPLEAYSISNAGQATPLLGVQKYLRFTQVDGKWNCALDTYLAKLPKGDLSKQIAVPSHLASLVSFTGDEYVTQLDSDEVTHYAYESGVWKHSAASPKKQGDVAIQTTPIPCKARYTCQWELYCSGINSDEGGGTSVPYTTNGDDCGEVPWGVTLGCGYETQYRLVNSFISNYVCDGTSPPTPPTYPDPNFPNIPPGPGYFPDGMYLIMNITGSDIQRRALSIMGNSQNDGALAILNSMLDYANTSAYWRLTNLANGYVTLTSVDSGKMLDVQWGATTGGTPIWLWSANGGNAQQWQIQYTGNFPYGDYYKIVSRQSGLVLDLNSSTPAIGTGVIQNAYNGNSTQHWVVSYVSH